MYGAGSDALLLTQEYKKSSNNVTLSVKQKLLCDNDNSTSQCEIEGGNYTPQIIFFVAQLISGIGGSLYYTLGVSYMDDNIKKSKTPALISKFEMKQFTI